MKTKLIVIAILIIAGILLVMSFGCAHAPYGIHELESGSKIVDKGADRIYYNYINSYKFIEKHCKQDVGCMKYWGMSHEQLTYMTEIYEEVKRRQESIDDDTKEIRSNIDEMEVLTNHVFEIESNIERIQ